jgi:hypothetical protein
MSSAANEYLAVSPSGKVVGGPYKHHSEALATAQQYGGYVQFQAAEGGAEEGAPREYDSVEMAGSALGARYFKRWSPTAVTLYGYRGSQRWEVELAQGTDGRWQASSKREDVSLFPATIIDIQTGQRVDPPTPHNPHNVYRGSGEAEAADYYTAHSLLETAASKGATHYTKLNGAVSAVYYPTKRGGYKIHRVYEAGGKMHIDAASADASSLPPTAVAISSEEMAAREGGSDPLEKAPYSEKSLAQVGNKSFQLQPLGRGKWFVTDHGEAMGSVQKLKAGWKIDAMHQGKSGREYDACAKAAALLDAHFAATGTAEEGGETNDGHGEFITWSPFDKGYVGYVRGGGAEYRLTSQLMSRPGGKRPLIWWTLKGPRGDINAGSDTAELMAEADLIEGRKQRGGSEAGEAMVVSAEAAESAPVIYEGVAAPSAKPARHIKALRWHRNPTGYEAKGNLGVFSLKHQKPNRRKDILPIILSLDTQPLKSFEHKADAQRYAQSYDEIVPFVNRQHQGPAMAPVKQKDATPLVHIERDPKQFEVCLTNAKRIGAIDTPRKIYDLLVESLSKSDNEIFVVIPLDVRLQLRCCPIEIARGQVSRVAVSVADVMTAVLSSHAEAFCVVHNHPSGDPTPSPADKALTKDIQRAVKIFGRDIVFIDHVVIGTNRFASIREGKVYKA